LHVAKKNKPIILSTGMATLAEIDNALTIFETHNNKDIILLQCTTNYPSFINESNIRAISTLKKSFNILTGYSDHTESFTTTIAAIALGSCLIERHFTLSKTSIGPDQFCSSDPCEMKKLVTMIRETEDCLGSGIKKPTTSEMQNALNMRRSYVAQRIIQKNEVLTKDNVVLKRPQNGLTGNMGHLIFGRIAKEAIAKDTVINFTMVE